MPTSIFACKKMLNETLQKRIGIRFSGKFSWLLPALCHLGPILLRDQLHGPEKWTEGVHDEAVKTGRQFYQPFDFSHKLGRFYNF
jgi:hypothetical protein